MALDDVAADQRGVAGMELLRNLVPLFYEYQFFARNVSLLDFKSIRLQVPDPR
jgi:hypothetical protein